MPANSYPGEFEQMVLVAVLRLRQDAFALSIIRELDRVVGREVSRGALYRALDRLESKGLVKWEVEEGGPERGGKRRRRFRLTGAGLAIVRKCYEAQQRLWVGLEPELDRGTP
ncbi:MAG: PadR family transcriptional regulator [Acidobacteria bacterium]|nr:PadR family transcriptional regulator [Acidobacteriota bacterium]